MVEHLPEFIDPLALAEKRRQFKGSLPLSKMSRLQDALLGCEGEARFELRFEKDGRIAAVVGLVEAELVLQCQCCLQPLPWPVSSVVRLGVVRSIDEANVLPESYEPLLLEGEGTVALADIVQEELLLALPAIPRHGCCEVAALAKEGEASPAPSPQRPNPFAVLAQLKQ